LELFISIDGNENVHNAIRGNNVFNKVIDGLNLLKENTLNFSFISVLSKLNKDYINDICDLGEKFGVKKITFTYLRNKNYERPFQHYCLSNVELAEIETQIDKIKNQYYLKIDPHFGKFHSINSNFFGCVAGVFECAVDPSGNMIACTVERDKKFGNLHQEPFKTIWNRVKEFSRKRLEKVNCNNCKFYGRCYGECDLCKDTSIQK
jgi:radical SAM protein with 4Fe4S-binding SPASM domain